ncbi:hypothetical protein TVAG_478800 [Trichomonas vaginalis G3]|uniref:Uncharacterized protein n=1 Tax=Trichomonas vaginalis (strain ATCC PRA-98 / G3) TaxID=412133 RepID=A2DZZ6_TRIV3|nr:hypothetical protein TVAGG3_0536050 [Trichomonas vaginalis G3]EAY14055.1 hypothetical protein TVAG_478800 [Trichomonas vaginalis G3]KAI5519503.1 hypothetical protein TVAGG3_0536050 [Trichomonas vaginalis G3]|eukprot:XP_001326278.1 hypothetical protein [Trichomonas vaginalis G3]
MNEFAEAILEKNFIQKMNSSDYKAKHSKELQWLNFVFGHKVNYSIIRSICMMLAEAIGLHFGRECYRRKSTCFFWLHLYFKEIQDYLSYHSISMEFTDGSRICIRPFSELSPELNSPHVPFNDLDHM